jgi:tetratricopeptide (TPR) repeat protein
MKANGLRSLAFADLYEGRYESARQAFEEALVLHEAQRVGLSVVRVHIFLALLLESQADRRGALEHLAEASRLDPQTSPIWMVSRPGFVYARFGMADAAEAVLEKIRPETDPGSPHQASLLHRLEGEIELARGRHGRALQLLQLARSEREDPLTYESLLRGYSEAGRSAEVVELHESVSSAAVQGIVLGWEPQLLWPEAIRRVAEAYRDEGRADEALTILDAFLEPWADADAGLPVREELLELRASLAPSRDATGSPH